ICIIYTTIARHEKITHTHHIGEVNGNKVPKYTAKQAFITIDDDAKTPKIKLTIVNADIFFLSYY
ncbi:hypothetical protein, partial [Mycoplasmopsis bovis]|uniref:hypothetical protein n=1 Tax=Mycoplasmopsis bovis TaxID=28903 RepID=UPI003D2B31A3